MNLQLLYPGVGGGIRFLPHPFIYNLYQIARVIVLKCLSGEFPGSPVGRTPSFHYREHRLDPWLEN